ncbi:MAG: hypothetical protein PHH60_02915 [Candidatus Margulisbacteria bacterium]|nr:hypothetical protein [Candidatus Margulisiibacteriota bacterium]
MTARTELLGPRARASIQLTKSKYDRRDIKAALALRGFEVPTLGWTVSILKNLSVEQYDQLLVLLDRVRGYVRNALKVKDNVILPLTLPWANNFKLVNLQEVLDSPEVMEAIFDRCIKSTGWRAPCVNLEILPWIYQNYTVKTNC